MFYAPTPPGTCLVPNWQEPDWIPPTPENIAGTLIMEAKHLIWKRLAIIAAKRLACLWEDYAFTDLILAWAKETETTGCLHPADHCRRGAKLLSKSRCRTIRKAYLQKAAERKITGKRRTKALTTIRKLEEEGQYLLQFALENPAKKRKYTRKQITVWPTLNL